MPRPATVLVVTGEASGDRHAARLVREMLAQAPSLRVMAVGGDALANAGAELVYRIDELSVVGITEVVHRLPRILRVMTSLQGLLRSGQIDLFIPVDFPDFNFRLAAAAHRAGVPVFYFIAPQVWAWRKGRLRAMARWCRHVAVIFPFEADVFEAAGIPVTFAGYPLSDPPDESVREGFRDRLALEPAERVLALMPGSRRSEVERHLPVMVKAWERLFASGHRLRPVVSRAPTVSESLLARTAEGLQTVDRPVAEIAGAADLVFCASGTATVDVALAGAPMIVIYKLSGLSWFLARRLVRLEHVAMVNLVAAERLVPELLQDAATPERLEREAAALLGDPARVSRMRQGYVRVRHNLSGGSGFPYVAQKALEIMPPRT